MKGSKNIQTWFQQEVYFWRLCYCILWVIFIQLLASISLTFLLNADIFHPIHWIQDFLNATFSLSAVGYHCILIAFAFGLMLEYAAYYSVVPLVFITRLEIVWTILKPSKLLLICGYSVCGGLLVAIWLNLEMPHGPFNGLTHPCMDDNTKQCLNESHLLLVLHGMFIGCLYGINLFVNNHNFLIFPIIQQNRFFQIKSGFASKVKASLTFVAAKAKWFIVGYAIVGLSLQIWVTNLLHVKMSSSTTLSHLWNLFNLKLWWTAWLTAGTANFLFTIIEFIFKIFQTQRSIFPITTTFEEEKHRDIKVAISTGDFLLLQHLGYLDLTLISQYSAERRQEIFSISQPGGHPHQWNAVVNACLFQINSLTQKIKACYEPVPPPVSSTTSSETSLKKSFQMSADYEKWRIQNLCSSPVLCKFPLLLNQSSNPNNFPPAAKPHSSIAKSLKSYVEKQTTSLCQAFSRIPIIAFFIKEIPEARIRRVFAECQLCIWAIEALSNFAAASFLEDKYGVCQHNLSEVLGAFLNLQQAINKVQKMEVLTSKRQLNSSVHSHDIALRYSLKCRLKLGLYLIATTFQNHLSGIDLAADHRKLLTHYMEFKE